MQKCGRFSESCRFRIVLYTTKGKFFPLSIHISERPPNSSTIRYTSLGSTFNTSPNPALIIQQSAPTTRDAGDSSAESSRSCLTCPVMEISDTDPPEKCLDGYTQPPSGRYKPAYELVDGSLERAGRSNLSATKPSAVRNQ